MNRKINKITLSFLLLCLSFFLISCKGNSEETVTDSSKLQVSVTFNALSEFVSAIGKDKVQVTTIIPAGTEPHDFEPKAADIADLSKAKLFVYNGFGMESWVEKAIQSAENTSLITVVASNGATPIRNTKEEEINENGENDPHIWLSLKGAETEVQNIVDGLVKADPANTDFYQLNAKNYLGQLDALFTEYQSKFSSLSNKNFVTGHAAFGYFCRDFGLMQNSVEDVFAEGEPSTKQLTDLVEYCKSNHVSTIFAEKMTNPEISQTLANEVGAKVQTIYTMEGQEDNLSYLERIRNNCEKVYQSLLN